MNFFINRKMEDKIKNVCKNFMNKNCKRNNCKFIHDTGLCLYYWRNLTNNSFDECKYGSECKKNHFVSENQKMNKLIRKTNRKQKNTECFEPMKDPVDMRVVYETNNSKSEMMTRLSSRDVLFAPNVFDDYEGGEIYKKLVEEINNCGIEEDKLLKMWHGNDKIEGTHLIANDRMNWKEKSPTFKFVIERLKRFFKMDIQATRFNWYKDTSQWKPFHFDAAAVKEDKAQSQNFTVAVSFGATRDAAFEHAKTKTVISMPQPDSCIYAFAKDTNIIWRHGILQDIPCREEGRISIIAWGWIDNMFKLGDTEEKEYEKY